MNQRKAIREQVPIVRGRPMTEEQVAGPQGAGNDIYYKGSLMLHTLRNLIGDDAFYAATRRLVYGRTDPQPGNFSPRYASTRDFIDAVNAETGRDYGWLFDVYLYSAKLPELVVERDATGLALRWETEDDKPFPMPLQVRVDGRDIEVPMTGGRGHVELPAHALYTIDPHSRVLRAQAHITAWQETKQ